MASWNTWKSPQLTSPMECRVAILSFVASLRPVITPSTSSVIRWRTLLPSAPVSLLIKHTLKLVASWSDQGVWPPVDQGFYGWIPRKWLWKGSIPPVLNFCNFNSSWVNCINTPYDFVQLHRHPLARCPCGLFCAQAPFIPITGLT